MKKFYLFLTAAVLAAACTAPEMEKAEPRLNGDGLMEMTFSATTIQTETKVILSDKDSVTGIRPILWGPCDSISVFDVNETPKQDAKLFNCSDTASARTSFRGTVAPSATGYYAVCPWQKVSVYDDEGLIEYEETPTVHLAWTGYNQEATAFGFDPKMALMMAYTESDSFEFKHVFAFVKIKTTFDCEWIEFAGNNSETLGCQDIWIQMKDGVPSIVKTSLNRAGTKSAKLQSKTSNFPAGTYLLAVIPQTLEKGFTLTFQPTEMTGTVSKSTSKSATLSRGNILNLGSFSKDDFSGFPSTGEFDGKGTEAEPYLITTVEQWDLLAERLNGRYATYDKYRYSYFKLTENLDFQGKTAGCVGNELERAFEGVFDGNGKTISNYYPSTGDGVEALFGYIRSATIKNLTVDPAGFKCRYNGFDDFSYSPLIGVSSTGTLMNTKTPRIIGCNAVHASSDALNISCGEMDCNYGSIVAWIRDDAIIMNCDSDVSICLKSTQEETGDLFCAGGIAGKIDDYYCTLAICIFDRCRNTGAIGVECYCEGMAGGILGYDNDQFNGNALLRVSNCENRGDITVFGKGYGNDEKQYAGGFVGKHDSDGAWLTSTDDDPFFYNCLNAGHVTTSAQSGKSAVYGGGFAGYCYDDDTKFHNCVSLWDPSGDAMISTYGVFTGGDYVGDFHNCYNYKSLDYLYEVNDYRSSIPEHPNKAIVFAEYEDNKIYQYCSWSGNITDRSLKLDF